MDPAIKEWKDQWKNSLKCYYCKLPIEESLILVNEKTHFGRFVNTPMHDKCMAECVNLYRNKELAFLGIGLSLFSIILSITLYFI